MTHRSAHETANREPVKDLMVEQVPALRRYAFYLCRSIDDADDLVQSCIARACSRIETFTPGTNLRAWLFTILRHLFINDIRKRRSQPVLVTEDGGDAHGLAIAAPQTSHLILREVSRAVGLLPEPQRQLIQLIAIEGASYEAAAELQKVPMGTVRSRLSRARQSLLDIVEGRRDWPELARQRCPDREEDQEAPCPLPRAA